MPEDFYEMYFELRKQTEAPAILHRWCITACVGAWLGRQTWLPFGENRIFPNQYIMIVGNPGVRKSTAIKGAARILQAAGYETFAPKKTSKEKFLLDLQEGQDSDESEQAIADIRILPTESAVPREVFIAADEFNVFSGHSNIEFFEILGDLWDWDNDKDFWKYRLKNSKSVRIWQPTVSILGGNTPTGFADCFPIAMLGQGFMSRLILVYADPSEKKHTFPPTPDEKLVAAIILRMREIKRTVLGPMTLHDSTKNILDSIYKSWPELEDARFQHYSSRRFQHLLKLCMIIAAMRCSTTISDSDVISANTILAFAETQMPKAMGELGKSRSSEAANKVMQLLYGARKPMAMQELWPAVRNDLERIQDLAQIISNLLQAGKIQEVELPNNRRGLLPKQSGISRKILYVNENILKGHELP